MDDVVTAPPTADTPDADTADADTPDAGTPAPGRRPRGAADRWRPLLLRWHFYAGILIGPFLLVATITGLLYVLVPQIDRAVYSHELTVDHVGSSTLPLGDQVAAARAAHPEGTIASVTPAPRAGDTTRVVLTVDDVPQDRSRTVFVDPYTGEVRGALTTYGDWLPVRAWFDDLHRNLHLGDVGRNYSEIAASWLWVVALGGLVLWIGYRRRTHKANRLLVPDRDAPKRRRTLSWHGAVGVWIILGLLVLSASGLSWSRYAGESISQLRTAMSWTSPSVSTSAGAGAGAGEHAGMAGMDGMSAPAAAHTVTDADYTRVLQTADDAGLVGPLVITPPATGGAAWSVAENARGYPSHFDAIAVDAHTFAVTDRVDFAQWPLAAKLTKWAISAHMGLFGVINQIVLILLAIGLLTVIVRGYLMWWRRRPAGGGLPKTPGRGALGSLRPVEAVVVVAAVAVIGWYVPWFGLPLALFVMVDTVRGIAASRRVEAGSVAR
nr:peptidase [Gordonia sp. NB41Y]